MNTRQTSIFVTCLAAACGGLPVPEVAITPEVPDTRDDLVVAVTGLDEQTDVTLTYRWFRDDVLYAQATGPTISADETTRGQRWRVEVTATRGDDATEPVTAAVEIANAAPTATLVIDPAAPSGADDLVAVPTFEDADGDAVTGAWSWTRNGVDAAISTDRVPADDTTVGDTWVATVVPTDGTTDGLPVSAQVLLGNDPPTLTNVRFDPDPPSAAADVRVLVDAADADGDTVTLSWQWKVNGATLPVTTDTLPASAISRGDGIEVSVSATDGEATVGPLTRTATAANATPTATALIGPPAAFETSTLTCTAVDVVDADGDAVTTGYRWEINGVTVNGATASTLTGERFRRGDQAVCCARPSDGTDTGTACSVALPIRNSLPVLASAALAVSPVTGVTLSATTGAVSDADGDSVVLRYAWIVEGTIVGTGTTLAPSAFRTGDTLQLRVTPFDGTDEGLAITTPLVVVGNGRPTVTSVTFAQSRPTDGEDLRVLPVAADPEGDSIGWTYTWYVNGALQIAAASDRLVHTRFVRGDTVRVVVVPSDPGGAGGSSEASTSIFNALPTITGATVSPVRVDESVTASCAAAGWYDADGDSPPTYDVSWYVNGTEVFSGSNTLTGASFSRGDSLRCSMMPYDGREFGELKDSPVVTVQNARAAISQVLLSDNTPVEGDTLTAVVNGLSDPDPSDAGNLTARVEWWVNDRLVGEVPALTSDEFDKGDLVFAIGTPHDGIDEGFTTSSIIATVGNTAPVMQSATLSPAVVRTNDTITATAVATDADIADTLTYTYRWLVAGAQVQTGSSNTLSGTLFNKNQQVRVQVTASDGTASSGMVQSSALTVQDTPAGAATISVAPRWARPGLDNLRCSVTVAATDPDPGDIVTYAATWTRDGVPHTAGGGWSGPTTTTFTNDTIPTADLRDGQVWVCTVTATSAAVTGGTSTGTAEVTAVDLFSLAAGGDFACGLAPDGTARCWGYNHQNRARPPANSVFVQLDAGPDAACGRRADGGVECWGDVPNVPPGVWKTVSVGSVHGCLINSADQIGCWGITIGTNLTSPAGAWRDVSVGLLHACAINSVGTVACWGIDDQGQTATPSGETFAEVDAGATFSCGRRTDGTLRCWGDSRLTTPPTGTFTQVSAGFTHACAIDTNDALHCWGDATVDLSAPSGRFLQVAAGQRHTCATATDGRTQCWGDAQYGQLQPPTLDVLDVIPGWGTTCAIDDTDGGLVCWGNDGSGLTEPPDVVATAASLGETHACAITDAEDVVCWGSDSDGRASPPPLVGVTQLSAGRNHTCALDGAGAIECWGDDSWGQATAPLGGGWLKVASGEHHSCGLDATQKVQCWGTNLANEISGAPATGGWVDVIVGVQYSCALSAGDNVTCWGSGAAAAPPGGVFDAITGGAFHVCARTPTGELTCWGDDGSDRASPPTGSYLSMHAGNTETCAIRDDGRPLCWGLSSWW